MPAVAIIIFILGYLAISLEHSLRLNKAASALITGVLCWLVYFYHGALPETATEELLNHLGDISSILFFLLGAMTIVELIDSHRGFAILSQIIKTRSKSSLLIIISVITFFLSAILDNLTTAIVMSTVSATFIREKEDRLWFAGMIIIAANAGGVWSPMGDVTTTILWIGGQITAQNNLVKTFLPSIVVCLVPLLIVASRFRGKNIPTETTTASNLKPQSSNPNIGNIFLFTGIVLLLFVPVFKIVTHTPPFMGMLLALALMWILSAVLHYKKQPEERAKIITPAEALRKIDAPSILFFLGILLAVSALESFGLLREMAAYLSALLKNDFMVGGTLGVLSSIIDNVPLVAAAQGMYSLSQYPTDHLFWEFLTLTTGVGGSIIIIGSAAGVAIMGIEQISFTWYLKKISWLAALGFAAGVALFMLQQAIF